MALTPEDIKSLMPSLEAYLSMKAAEGLDMSETSEAETSPTGDYESTSHEKAEAAGGEKPPGGLAVVIDMKPKKPGMGSGKVPGCPDCEDGTPHEHVK